MNNVIASPSDIMYDYDEDKGDVGLLIVCLIKPYRMGWSEQ